MRWYLLIVLVSLLPVAQFLFAQDLPHTHDGGVHLPRIAAYYKALSDGQIPVRWAGDLNYGYGLPLFNFIYQTPYVLSSLFVAFGATLVDAFTATLVLSYILSGICMLLFTRAFFRDDKKAFLVTIFYQFASFRFVELFVRGSFGEAYTYTFLPLVLFGLTKLNRRQTFPFVFLTAVAIAFLVLSHNSVSLLFFGIVTGFVLLFMTGRARVLGAFSLLLGLLLSAFYWFPALIEHRYTYGDLFMKALYLEHFAPFLQILIPNFTNNQTLQTGGVAVQIGLFHVIALVLSLWMLRSWKKLESKMKKILIGNLTLIFVSLFFMLPISQILWDHIAILRQFQFPWRFLSVIVFATSMLSITFLTHKFFQRAWLYVALLIFVIASTVFYWRPSLGYDKIEEDDFWNFPLNTTYYGETDLIWSAGPAGSYPKNRVEVIGGKSTILDFRKKSNLHTFTVDATGETQLVDHTQYYPGWNVYIDGKRLPDIQYQDPNWRGQLTFHVPAGVHSVRVIFEETKQRLLADLASLITLVILLVIYFRPQKNK